MLTLVRNNPLAAVLANNLAGSRLLILVVFVHFLAAVAVGAVTGIRFSPGMARTMGMLFTILLPLFVFILIFWHFLRLAVRDRPDRPIARFVSDLRTVILDADRIVTGFLSLVLITLFMGTFSYFKAIIPFLNPFEWDIGFARLDRLVHGGVAPYRLLLPFFGNPLATTVLNGLYHLWFFMVYFIVFISCFTASHDRFARVFLLSLVLTFAIGGNALATVFSSAGPVYFERLGHGKDFVPLMDMLQGFNEIMPVWALGVQEALWQSHVADGPISGISAMPSMHVASTTLLALYGRKKGRVWGLLLGAFAVSIMIGSVHLGWHYAIDGYVGAILAVAIWRICDVAVK